MTSILIRPFEPGDHSFVLDSAWRSIREHPAAQAVNPRMFADLIEPFLTHWTTLVAADDESPRVIHSWLCYQTPHRVAWGFTKPDRRHRGIMAALRQHAGVTSTFELLFPTLVDFERLRPRWRPYLALEAA